ncbi:MAG: 1-(5-phosphoribosyl)-5-[(5-phosphoribosylamino)methylideneamino]imidazole-4-carboxamide isomerase [Deltaproteobacteria bacterium]|nr:1-(5-phosphoribosyl)-5-[(5-phosphoribosylamino)methylideneamino]imidazole-4-carboxamide isomerase [Deltaproteobacteria bacterium]
MIVIPAIDLLDGRAVRLRQGRREEATVYGERPEEVAAGFAAAGARRLHVVDLDGAFAGHLGNLETVRRIIAAAPGLEVEVGGGVRDLRAARSLVEAGARFVVLGTAAVKDPEFLAAACAAWTGRVIVAVDARDGLVAVAGWTEGSTRTAIVVGLLAARAGAAAVLYTDISRDGLQTGVNLEATRALAAALAPLPVIASGGVGSLRDLEALGAVGTYAVVVGRALYERAFSLSEALALVGSRGVEAP